MEYSHITVLLKQAVDSLNIRKDGIYIDATLGGGGHFLEIAKRLNTLGGGIVIGMDMDEESIEHVKVLLNENKSVLTNTKTIIIKENFSHLKDLLKNNGITSINGILYDLGVSSYQIDSKERGFSYMNEGPLDMRMDRSALVKAEDLVNGLYEKELEEILTNYGEERYAKRIARGIVKHRKLAPINTTNELVRVIKRSVPLSYGSSHTRSDIAKRVFQALRIAVNLELESLSLSLPQAFEILAFEGTLSVISFHSLEERIVKDFFKEKVKEGKAKLNLENIVLPSEEELEDNSRSRSAKLRSIVKINN